MTPTITLPRATVEQALEAMRCAVPTGKITLYAWDKAISDLDSALAQQAEPVQEPVAWECKAGGLKALTQRQYDAQPPNIRRHYTRIAPPQRKPLTSDKDRPDQGATYIEGYGYVDTRAVRAIERAHGIGGQE